MPMSRCCRGRTESDDGRMSPSSGSGSVGVRHSHPFRLLSFLQLVFRSVGSAEGVQCGVRAASRRSRVTTWHHTPGTISLIAGAWSGIPRLLFGGRLPGWIRGLCRCGRGALCDHRLPGATAGVVHPRGSHHGRARHHVPAQRRLCDVRPRVHILTPSPWPLA